MNRRLLRGKEGQTLLIIVILFLFLIAGLEAAVLLYMYNHHRLKVKEVTLTDDFYYAHAGIERAKWKIKAYPNPYTYRAEAYFMAGSNVPIVITVVPEEPPIEPPPPRILYRVNSFVLQRKSGDELSVARRVEAILERTEEVVDGDVVSRVNLIEWHELSPQTQSITPVD